MNQPWGQDKINQVVALYTDLNNISKVAKEAGVPRRTVRRWLSKLDKQKWECVEDNSEAITDLTNHFTESKIAITSYFDGTSIDGGALSEFSKLSELGYNLYVIPITMRSTSLRSKPNGELPELPSNVSWATGKLIQLTDELVLINNSGYRQRVTHFRDVSSSVIVPHHSFTLLSTPNVFNHKVNYVISTGSISKLSSYSKNHAGMVMQKSHKLGCLLINLNDRTMIQKDLTDDTNPQTLVMGDVHLPFYNEEDFKAFESKLLNYVCTHNVKEVVFHDYVDFGFASHHLYNSGFGQIADRSEDKLRDTVEKLLTQHCSILTTLAINNVKMRVVYSNHDNHYIKGLLSLNPKQLTNLTEQYLYYGLALESLRDRDKNPIEMFFDVLVALYSPESIQRYVDYTNKVDFQFLSVYNNKQVAGYFLGLHGDHGANGSRFSPEQIASIGVKAIVGHAHTASRFNDVLTVGTSSPMDMKYNAKGLSSWSACDVIVTDKSAYHIVKF